MVGGPPQFKPVVGSSPAQWHHIGADVSGHDPPCVAFVVLPGVGSCGIFRKWHGRFKDTANKSLNSHHDVVLGRRYAAPVSSALSVV